MVDGWSKKTIGNQFIIENKVLGRGQYGEVYLAWFMDKSKNNGKPIAVKVIDKKKLDKLDLQKPGFREKTLGYIRNEAEIQIKIKNPYIVELHQVNETPNNVYFFLEYCKDGDLNSFLNKKCNKPHLSEVDSIVFFQQICEAFKLLKQMKICHRDLKPHNILMHEGQLKIGDFGFSKVVEGELQSKHSQVGSPIYMSPQALEGQIYDPEKQDIWSCGVILYQMLYGKYPWSGTDIIKLYSNIQQFQLEIPNEPYRSQEIKDLLINMLQREEEDRWGWEQVFQSPIVTQNIQQIDKDNMSEQIKIFIDKKQDQDLSEYQYQKKQNLDSPTSSNLQKTQSIQEQNNNLTTENNQQKLDEQRKQVVKLIHHTTLYALNMARMYAVIREQFQYYLAKQIFTLDLKTSYTFILSIFQKQSLVIQQLHFQIKDFLKQKKYDENEIKIYLQSSSYQGLKSKIENEFVEKIQHVQDNQILCISKKLNEIDQQTHIDKNNYHNYLGFFLYQFRDYLANNLKNFVQMGDRRLLMVIINISLLQENESILKRLGTIPNLNRYLEQFDSMDNEQLKDQIINRWKLNV